MEGTSTQTGRPHEPWNKGKLVGQKAPFKLKEVWAIRVWLQLEHRTRELALFDLGLDSKLRSCDLVKLRVRDICHGDRVAARASEMQQKTSRPVQFEITGQTRTRKPIWKPAGSIGITRLSALSQASVAAASSHFRGSILAR